MTKEQEEALLDDPKPAEGYAKPETRGRKPLPPEQKRVQRTVSLDHADFERLTGLARERGQSVPQCVESIVAVYLAGIGGEK